MWKYLGLLATLVLVAAAAWPQAEPKPTPSSAPQTHEAEESFFAKAVLDGIVGAIAGGVLGAVVSLVVDGRRKRREVSIKIVERMVSEFHDMASVLWLLQNPESLAQPENINRVLVMGNWFDLVAAICSGGYGDANLLESIGVKKQMFDFLTKADRASQEASKSVSLKEIGAKLRTATQDDWKGLVNFTNFSFVNNQEGR
ncbi:MAG TPA: hypothetical protein VFB76_04625 [Candidatus Angelobacter sp.]|nr:hypothetical protein [Candidatus Angelobacter sp.]